MWAEIGAEASLCEDLILAARSWKSSWKRQDFGFLFFTCPWQQGWMMVRTLLLFRSNTKWVFFIKCAAAWLPVYLERLCFSAVRDLTAPWELYEHVLCPLVLACKWLLGIRGFAVIVPPSQSKKRELSVHPSVHIVSMTLTAKGVCASSRPNAFLYLARTQKYGPGPGSFIQRPITSTALEWIWARSGTKLLYLAQIQQYYYFLSWFGPDLAWYNN